MRLKSQILATVILVLMSAGSAIAQKPLNSVSVQRLSRVLQQGDEVGRLLERSLTDLEHYKIEGKIKDSKIAALEAQVKAADDLLTIYKSMADEYKIVATARAAANGIDDKRVANYEAQIKSYEASIMAYKAEVEALRIERDKLKSQRNWLVIGAFILGGIGYAIGSN